MRIFAAIAAAATVLARGQRALWRKTGTGAPVFPLRIDELLLARYHLDDAVDVFAGREKEVSFAGI
jgi:hypothetical protein